MQYQPIATSPAYMFNLSYDGRMNRRTRWGGGLRLDYKLDDDKSIFTSFTFSPHMENAVVPVTTVSTAQTIATLDAQGRPTGTGAILPGYTDNRTEARNVTQSQVALSNLHRQRKNRAYSIQVGGKINKPSYLVDYDASYSYSHQNQYLHTVTSVLRGVGFIFDRTNMPRWTPTLTYTSGPDPANLDNYVDHLLTRTLTPSLGPIKGARRNFH
jgi:hypothetical protein